MTAVSTPLRLPSHYAKHHQLFTTHTETLIGSTTFVFRCTLVTLRLYILYTGTFVCACCKHSFCHLLQKKYHHQHFFKISLIMNFFICCFFPSSNKDLSKTNSRDMCWKFKQQFASLSTQRGGMSDANPNRERVQDHRCVKQKNGLRVCFVLSVKCAVATHLSNHFHCRKREKYMDSW